MMEDKINLHIVLTGGSAQLYRMLSDKKAGVSYALRLLAQSDVASSMFENMAEVNAFMMEDMKRVEFAPKIERQGLGIKNNGYTPVASISPATSGQSEEVNTHGSVGSAHQVSHKPEKIKPVPPKELDEDETGFSSGWPQS